MSTSAISPGRPSYHVSFTDTSGAAHATSCDHDTHIGSSSPSPPAKMDALVPSSSSPARPEMVPLGAAKTVAIARRGVIFSPRTDTKYFHTDDLILPSPTAKTPLVPSSIRSYSDPVTPHDSPSASRGKGRLLSDTPILVRSILKARAAQQIRLAASVEEGTLNNKEAARLLVSGKRPGLLARDSYQLAMLRGAAGESADRKGKGRMQGEVPGSDDSAASTSSALQTSDPAEGDGVAEEGSSEEEEETIEEDGALATGSLINIILDGAEDLLTLEEAYSTLTQRLRQQLTPGVLFPIPVSVARMCTQPIRDEAPAMVRAIQRDLARLLGKLPHSDPAFPSSDNDAPFMDLMPLKDRTPTHHNNNRSRFTPSPTPGTGPKSSSPTKPTRQGYTESEVRYRREASGVGAAVLRFIDFIFSEHRLSSCYSEADLQSILEQVMVIPRTPRLPTPNPKRTYYLSILILTHLNLPSACVQPVKDKIVRALEGAMTDSLGALGPSGKEGPPALKKEGYHAITNLVSNYPSIFFPHYSDLLIGCLRGMASSSNLIRYKAGAAACAFARAKFALLANTQSAAINNGDAPSREAWVKAKSVIQKSEFFVISHLKSALKVPGKSTPVYGKDGEKKTEWHALEQIFKDTVGSTTDVHWACAAWSVVVTLMGAAYASSGLAGGLDHIMDRSLQPSTNTVRPLLARAAWNHAIHAYLSSGFASSITPNGELIRSYKPFAASSQQTIEQRTAAIQLVVDLALSKATDKMSYARALTSAKLGNESHYVWQRSEKTKKFQWLVTCGLGATAVVYAHTGIALRHEDQPAKEMSAISGLPSSDGIPVPDMTPEEARLPRLDNAFEKVVQPMLRSFFAIRGVDRLTTHGWSIFDAITSPRDPRLADEWSLDKLLVKRYMSGEIFSKEKDADIAELLEDIQYDDLEVEEIPSWGLFWAAKRLGRLLVLFDEALTSIHGINDPSTTEWIKSDVNGVALIPVVLSDVWSNLLYALKSIQIARAPPTPLFLAGLQAVTQQLLQVYSRDPKTYVPISRIDAQGHCTVDEHELRLSLTAHLFQAAFEILGEDVLVTTRLRMDQIPSQEQNANPAQIAMGLDNNGSPTFVGSIIGQLLRSKAPQPVQPTVQRAFRALLGRVLHVACAPGYAGKLLGDITNALPFLFEDSEEYQLDVWRLVGPFRGRQISSFWHRHADQNDLRIWQSLLRVTVLRFRAKRVGSNFGVIEALAGHLSDFLDEGEKTRSTTITLSCLASATSWISFVPSEESHASPWQIDENYVPVDFLSLVNSALEESYPSPESQTSTDTETGAVISPAVEELLVSLSTMIEKAPVEFVRPVLEALRTGLSRWMEDPEQLGLEIMDIRLDELYITIVRALGQSIAAGHIAADSDLLNTFVDLYAPRLSRAQTPAVPLAFQDFWAKTFAQSSGLEYSDDVAGFLRDLLAAVPGIITAPGLSGESPLSVQESLAKYPHLDKAKPTAQAPETMSVETGNATEVAASADVDMDDEPIPPPTAALPPTTGEYDADVSQSIEQTQVPEVEPQTEHRLRSDHVDDTTYGIVPPSPAVSDVGSEQYVSDEASLEAPAIFSSNGEVAQEEDVFGPASLTSQAQAKSVQTRSKVVRGRGKKRVNKKTKYQGKLVAEQQAEAAGEREVQPSPNAKSPGIEGPRTERQDGVLRGGSSDDELSSDARLDVETSTSAIPPDTELVHAPHEENNAIELPKTGPVDVDALIASGSPVRPSLLSSASRWLSKVPSFPFFSPSTSDGPPPGQALPQSPSLIEIAPKEPKGSEAVHSRPAPEEKDTIVVLAEQESPIHPLRANKRGGRGRKRRSSVAAPITDIAVLEVHSPVAEPEPASEIIVVKDDIQTASTCSTYTPLVASSSTESISSTTTVSRSRGKGKRKAGSTALTTAAEDYPPKNESIEIEDAEPRRSKRRKTKPSALDEFTEEPQIRKRKRTQSQSQAQPPLVARQSVSPVPASSIDVNMDEEDDELLLSPETARIRKKEEDEAIRASQGHGSRLESGQGQSQWSESISGRFDDAPEDESSISLRPGLTRVPSSPSPKSRTRSQGKATKTLSQLDLVDDVDNDQAGPSSSSAKNTSNDLPTSLPVPSPLKRTSQQKRMLELIDEAVRGKELIDKLDFEGVKALLKNVNMLREAAEERMMARLEELRGTRR
ncbi:hypothetical protein I316_07924 [Kwoniella heveanensis BCC8398]|uniref:Telomere-associated protein Rif1 N-terminal domain-containing protein n=1 Tax=Kwoniella heveanensis BCC8398 TaxID=1296120 RepID=A0A1B9GHI6_9TREE|nr:hypothetical protein I316_07924 [Kwoniella heveanensis BCC8398]